MIRAVLRRLSRQPTILAMAHARRQEDIASIPILTVGLSDETPQRSPCPPIVTLDWDAYDEWERTHGNDAA